MLLERKQDLSIYYWLVDQFADAPFVTIEDGFPEQNLRIPSIVVEWDDIRVLPLELGNRRGLDFRMWVIDVFATNKSQRDEFAYRIKNALDTSIDVNDYDEGFPPDVTPSRLGGLIPKDIKIKPIKVHPELTKDLFWRAAITFVATYSTNT